MKTFHISGHFFVEPPSNSSVNPNLIGWGVGRRDQKNGIAIDIDENTVNQENMNAAIQGIISTYRQHIEKLTREECRVSLVMGFFFDTSKISAFGMDISNESITDISKLHLNITIDVFPCSELDSEQNQD